MVFNYIYFNKLCIIGDKGNENHYLFNIIRWLHAWTFQTDNWPVSAYKHAEKQLSLEPNTYWTRVKPYTTTDWHLPVGISRSKPPGFYTPGPNTYSGRNHPSPWRVTLYLFLSLKNSNTCSVAGFSFFVAFISPYSGTWLSFGQS